MLEIPVSVLGTDYDVKVGNREELELGEKLCGQCCNYLKELHIEHSMRDCNTKEERNGRTCGIVAHEVFHAYVHESGLNLPEDVEETLALWYEVMWYKINQTISDICENIPFDKEEEIC